MSPEAYTEYLHRHIPLTAAMQLRVLRSGAGTVELAAPLAPNLNHRGTAFGGSLVTLGIASGWALLQRSLAEAGVEARIVVQKSECEYLLPVEQEFVSSSRLPEEWPQFLDTLRKRGRARITVHSSLHSAGQEVVRHSGVFVAIAGPDQ